MYGKSARRAQSMLDLRHRGYGANEIWNGYVMAATPATTGQNLNFSPIIPTWAVYDPLN